jgi:Icc-related predicted phosphoesterase
MAGNKPTLKQKIVREYIKKFPRISNYALANKIFKEHPLEFDNVENIRTMIRYVTGSNGSQKNKEVKDKSLFRPARTSNDYLLPQSYANDFTPYEIKQSRILIISDLHFPYQNNEAIILALDYGKEKKVDCILINGDLMDQANISRHERDWRARSIAEEFEAVRVFLKSLRLHFPKTKIVWKLGNHEERWEKFLYNKAPEIFDVNDFQLEVLLKLGELKIEIIKDKRPIILGKLTVLHGHELMGMGGVNPARATFTKTMEDTLVGHYHRTSSHSEPTMNNRVIMVHSTGCLCEMNPMFMPINKWNLGFSYVDLNIITGEYVLENKKIIKGKIY